MLLFWRFEVQNCMCRLNGEDQPLAASFPVGQQEESDHIWNQEQREMGRALSLSTASET